MAAGGTTLRFEEDAIGGRTFARPSLEIARLTGVEAVKRLQKKTMYKENMQIIPSSFERLSAALARLSNGELLEHVEQLACDERNATARLVASLAEVDRRQLYRDAGCSSLFTFCTDVLRLSESEAYLRIEAARAARKFPLILERLADASITLTSVSKLARHLTAENHRELIDSVRHKSKREIEEIIARVHPQPDAREMVRRLPVRNVAGTLIGQAQAQPQAAANESSRVGRVCGPQLNGEPAQGVSFDAVAAREVAATGGPFGPIAPTAQDRVTFSLQPMPLPPPPAAAADRLQPMPFPPRPAGIPTRPRASVTPLAPKRYRVQLTIGAETDEKLRRVRDLLRHEIPDGDLEKVFDRAVTRLLADLEKRRFGATTRRKAQRPAPTTKKKTGRNQERKPGPSQQQAAAAGGPAGETEPRSRSRRIPSAVKREVWLRDEGRCTFAGPRGRCQERGMLEYHHRQPFADGGEATGSNVTLLCRAHNSLEADRYFGPLVSAIHSVQTRSSP